MSNSPLIKIENLTKTFSFKNQILTAVNNLSLTIHKGETLGLAGESGCGKSTVGKSILGLYPLTNGSIYYQNQNISDLSSKEMRSLRKKMQMIFQDPYSSLNPRMKIRDIIGEPLDIHQLASGKAKEMMVEELIQQVGLNPDHLDRYPHEFSGGQRQRIGIARALAVDPEFIVCDEPLSALDVTTQAQIVHLLKRMQKEKNLTYLFISHDLALMESFADRIAIMYLGNLVELASSKEICSKPLHPYSQLLFSAIPIPDPMKARKQSIKVISGEASRDTETKGCAFAHRCALATEKCRQEKPVLKEVGSSRLAACHLL